MSWQIQRARERGIPFDSVYFDSQGNMRYNDTDEIVESTNHFLSISYL